jgi:hypothetical protein
VYELVGRLKVSVSYTTSGCRTFVSDGGKVVCTAWCIPDMQRDASLQR